MAERQKIGAVEPVEGLRGEISGVVLLPGDEAYEEMRLGWNRAIDQRPALIVVASHVEDVQKAVRYADAHNLGIAVQLTGHGIKYPADDNMLILTTRLNQVSVDAQARTARVEGGVVWQQVLDAATPHGLAPLLGTSPHVGVTGYTLGGGIGWLARRYGLAADSVRSIEVVTPDGELHHCSAAQESELFWGLRGGGGNFGVVTAMEFALYPVSTLYGGALTYPGVLAGDALRFYREWIKDLPDELTSSILVIKYPPLPQLPDAMRGKLFVVVRAAYVGERAQGEQLMKAWLEWQAPLTNTLREVPFSEVGTISNDSVTPVTVYPSSDMLRDLPDEAIEIITRYATESTSPVVASELRHAGGAISRADSSANAIGNRDATFYLVIGGPAFTAETRAAMEPYIRRYKDELRPYLHGGIYLNFAGSSEARERVKDAYSPQDYARLLALKQQVDPKNLFRYSFPLVSD
jgi:FAD/FMN-containing dehydrogenase